MNLLQAIVKLLCQTKIYMAFPKIIERLLALMIEYSNDIPEAQIFTLLNEVTSEKFGPLPFIPDESDGYILVKNIETGRWDIFEMPIKLDLRTYQLYGRYGDKHSIRALQTGELIALTMAKVSGDRIYTSNPNEPYDKKARSIVYENIIDESINIATKNVNITFLNCRQLNINLNECPVGGIKMVRCIDCSVRILDCTKSPIVPIYAFYCSDCQIKVPDNFGGTLEKEIFECMNFSVSI